MQAAATSRFIPHCACSTASPATARSSTPGTNAGASGSTRKTDPSRSRSAACLRKIGKVAPASPRSAERQGRGTGQNAFLGIPPTWGQKGCLFAGVTRPRPARLGRDGRFNPRKVRKVVRANLRDETSGRRFQAAGEGKPRRAYCAAGPSGFSADIAKTTGSRSIGPYGSEASYNAAPLFHSRVAVQIPVSGGFDVFEIAVPGTVNRPPEYAVGVGAV